MEHLEVTGLTQMCRLCLSYSVTMTDVFCFSSELEKEIADIIMECAPIQITRHDKMPTCICQLCFTQLKKFHQFQMQAVQSDRTLQRYLQKSSACHPQIELESALEEQSNNSESQTYNADVTTKCEPFEISDEFNNLLSKQTVLANSSVNKVNDEIPIKLEIKDEPMNDDYVIPAECVETVNTLSMYDGNGISCEDSMIVVGNFECPIKFENDKMDKKTVKSEETFIPLKEDDSNLCSENIKDVEYLRSNDNNLNKTEHTSKRENLTEKFHSVLLKPPATSTGRKSYQCGVCQKCFRSTGQLKRHNLIHTGEKPYQCDICQMRFIQTSQLQSHKLKHTGEKPYQCEICQKRLTSLRNLKKHNLIHTGEKPYQCDICQKFFRRTSHLQSHKLKHTGEKPYQCDICKMGFSNSSILKRHQLIHTGEKPYQCDICRKCFRSANQLKKHNLTHTGEKPYQCDICQKCFRQAIHLKSHNSVHTGEKPYQCDICKMRFRLSGTLQSHKLIHTGEKPYQCDICKKCFSWAGQLKRHNLIHIREKPYQCDI